MTGDILASLPTDAISLLALIIVVIGQVYQRRRDTALHAQVGNVEHHVANTHDTNLRDDIDGLKVSLVNVERAVGRIGDEVRDERKANSADRREMWAHIRRQDRIADKHHPDEP